MRSLLLLPLAAALVTAAPAPVTFDWFEYTGRDQIFEQPLPAGHFRNPILTGFYPDPSITRAGDDYYLVCSTFSYFPGLPIFHSRDLVNWEQIGNAIDRPTQLKYDGLGLTRGIFAPAIHQHNGTFYLTCTMVDSGGNFLMTAKDPAGPWSDPLWLDFDGIDPSLFFDDDGRAWMLNNGNPPENKPLYQGHRAIWIQEFDVAKKQLIGPRSIIVNGGVDLSKKPVWIEGPHIFKKDGWYYLSCAEGGTSLQHSQVILRSKAPTGPFVPWEKNPILTQRDLDGTAPNAVTCTGHAQLVVGPDGNWWATFLACRPFAKDYWLTGRETFLLPVKWTDDGWPVILPASERVPYVVAAPVSKDGRAKPLAEPSSDPARRGRLALPLNGNFTWRDDFTDPKLSLAWMMLRTPKETWWQLTAGKLNLAPRSDTLSGKANPSFLGRRVQHARFDSSLSLEVPASTGTSAGLVALQDETHYYYLGVKRTASGLALFLEKSNGKTLEVVATTTLPDTRQVVLRISGDEKVLSCAYATTASDWKTLVPDADALAISVQAAGGGLHFTGAVVGPYARAEP